MSEAGSICKRHSLHSVELSQQWQIVSTPPAPSNGGPITIFGQASHAELLGDVETNPGPTTSHKQVWICDICHIHIQVRKQISIRI